MDEQVRFDYFEAFQRNLGFVSRAEQQRLREARVAIAGLGGTGGAQCHALARMGIGRFKVTDPDSFELANFNRQMGASMSTLGLGKAEVARRIIQEINPEAEVETDTRGLSEANVDAFLDRVDIVIDSLDFYCFEERFLLYRSAREKGLWVLTAPPLGFGFSLLAFDPKGMTFERYFDFGPGRPVTELAAHLITGIAPTPYFFRYLLKDGLDVKAHRLPSVGAAPFLIGGVIATEVCKHLTQRGDRLRVPQVLQYDAWTHGYRLRSHRMGMRSPLSRFKIARLRRFLEAGAG